MITGFPPPPIDHQALCGARYDRQVLRRALLLQDYGDDRSGEANIRPVVDTFLGPERAALIPALDFSNNILHTMALQLTTPGLYNVAPEVTGDPVVSEAMTRGGYWLQMQLMQFLAAGMGDAFLHFELADGRLRFQEVPAHMLIILERPDRPGEAVVYRWLRLFDFGGEVGLRWCWEVYDLQAPAYYVEEANPNRTRVTQIVPGMAPEGVEGAAYPWRYADGTPYAPIVHYYCEQTPGFWRDNTRRGVTRGTISQMAFGTMAGQSAMDASHSTALVFGARPPIAPVQGSMGDGAAAMAVSRMQVLPGSILFLEAEEGVSPSATQLRPSADLPQLRLWKQSEEAAFLTRMGLSADDVQVTAANPTSAASLAIRNSAKRMVLERMEPFFRASDANAFRIAGALLRGAEEGYSFAYAPIPQSPDDEKTTLEAEKLELEMGLTSRVTLYMRHHPGTTRQAAIAALRQVAADEAALGAVATQPDPMTPETPQV